ncbi:hypothetical protein [Nocardiopsis baichengensis]|uniref:hypothetical protein n=1 Tax=Nocardiopsis baichengensis TaxID=280240 RepID=UPI0004767283|nr:hypothetical protein [Nocardiopsis baichengensis]
MSEQPDRLVLDFLSRVGEAAYGAVPSRRRASFLADVRRRVEEARRASGARTAEEVRRVLESFGDPDDLVRAELDAERGPEDGDGEDGDGADGDGADGGERADTGRSVLRKRTPPPWRGGPDPGWLGARGARAVSVRPESGGPITPTTRIAAQGDGGDAGRRLRRWSATAAAFRDHPSELLVLLLYAAGALAAEAAFLWIIGGAMVVLSKVWTRRDKWVLAGAPPAATLVAMAFWPGEAPYIDQIVLESLTSTGVVGLRLAAAACAVYLVVRIAAVAPASGHRPLNPPEYPA